MQASIWSDRSLGCCQAAFNRSNPLRQDACAAWHMRLASRLEEAQATGRATLMTEPTRVFCGSWRCLRAKHAALPPTSTYLGRQLFGNGPGHHEPAKRTVVGSVAVLVKRPPVRPGEHGHDALRWCCLPRFRCGKRSSWLGAVGPARDTRLQTVLQPAARHTQQATRLTVAQAQEHAPCIWQVRVQHVGSGWTDPDKSPMRRNVAKW